MTNTNRDSRPEALPLLDAEEAIRDMGGDREGYCEVSAIFLEELPALLELLHQRSFGTPAAIMPVIHEASNSLGVIRARRGESQLRQLERVLRTTVSVTAHDACQSATVALKDAAVALRAWMTSAS